MFLEVMGVEEIELTDPGLVCSMPASAKGRKPVNPVTWPTPNIFAKPKRNEFKPNPGWHQETPQIRFSAQLRNTNAHTYGTDNSGDDDTWSVGLCR